MNGLCEADNHKKPKIQKEFFVFDVLCIFLFFSLLNSSQNEMIRIVGNCGILGCLAVLSVVFFSNIKRIKFTWIHISIACYLFFCFLRVLINGGHGIVLLTQMGIVFLLFVYIPQIDHKKLIDGLYNVLALSVFLAALDMLINFYHGNGINTFFYGNANKIGLLGFLFTFVSAFKKFDNVRIKLISVFIGILTVFLSGTRTALLAISLAFIVYLLTNGKSRLTVHIVFAATVIFSILFMFVYTYNELFPFLSDLDKFIYDLTGKQLFSGRNRIWKAILDNFDLKNIVFGYGLGFEISNLSGVEASAHNQFLQIFVQQGIIGLLILGAVIYCIYLKTYKEGNSSKLFFIIIVLIYNLFEVCLIQNHFCIGMFFWTIMFADIHCKHIAETLMFTAPRHKNVFIM